MIVTGKVSLVKTAIDLRWRLLVVLLVSLAVTYTYEHLDNEHISIQITPITALGVAIGLFLGFRCTVVWSRYWEARTLWGRLINASRTYSRQIVLYTGGLNDAVSAEIHREMCLRLIVYVKALKVASARRGNGRIQGRLESAAGKFARAKQYAHRPVATHGRTLAYPLESGTYQ